MDDATAREMNAMTGDLVPQEEAQATVKELLLGPDGTDGVMLPEAKAWAQERADAKKANQATEDYLRGKPLKDQKVKAAVRLSKVAPRIFAAVRANPPEWLPEFDEFVRQTLGKRPSENFRHQAAMEWDAAVMFGLLCYGNFAAMMAEDEEEDDDVATPEPAAAEPVAVAVDAAAAVDPADVGDVLVDPRDDQPVAPVVDPGVGEVAGFKGSALVLDPAGNGSDTFSILGADGEPVIEGLR